MTPLGRSALPQFARAPLEEMPGYRGDPSSPVSPRPYVRVTHRQLPPSSSVPLVLRPPFVHRFPSLHRPDTSPFSGSELSDGETHSALKIGSEIAAASLHVSTPINIIEVTHAGIKSCKPYMLAVPS